MPSISQPVKRDSRAIAPGSRSARGDDCADRIAETAASPADVARSPRRTRAEAAKLASDASAAKRAGDRADALADLPPLRTPEDALDRLDRIGRLALRGIVPGSGAHAAGQATRTWLEVQKAAATLTRVRQLTDRIEELERELLAARAMLGAPGHAHGA